MRWLLGVTDRDRAQRLPVRGQLQDRPDDIGGEDRRSDPRPEAAVAAALADAPAEARPDGYLSAKVDAVEALSALLTRLGA